MENDNLAFPPDRERLEYIERTVSEHSAQDAVDVQSIVVNAMNAYWDKRVKESIAPDLDGTTANILREAARLIRSPRSEIVNGVVGVLVPSLVYLFIIYLVLSQRGDWETPVSVKIVALLVSVPIAMAITLVFVSGPRREFTPRPLGVFRNTVAGFMTRVPIGAAFVSLLLTAVTTWVLIYQVDAKRETRAITFNSAQTILVDKSLSMMKDLQAFPDTKVVESTTEIKLSATNVMSMTTHRVSPGSKAVKSVIEDQGAFPGQLSADFDAGSGTVFWTEEGKSGVAQTKIYVCTIKSISGEKVFVEAVSRPNSADNASSANTGDSKGRSATQNAEGNVSNDSVITSINLTVNGASIELTFKPQLVNAYEFSKGQNLILAYDAKSHVATRIEPIFSSASSKSSTE